ncbi:MAG: hypothetical protein RLZZ516_1469 [Cyanobacteriota bacterium]|jgi:hypothetical protein
MKLCKAVACSRVASCRSRDRNQSSETEPVGRQIVAVILGALKLKRTGQ